MKRFIYVCAIALSIAGCLFGVCLGQRHAVEGSVDRSIRLVAEGMGETSIEYQRPTNNRHAATGIGDEARKEKTKLYEEETEEETEDDYAFELDDDFKERRAATAYPTLYRPGNATGVVVVIGFPECGWCGFQLNAIPGVEFDTKKKKLTESTDYRVLYVHKDKSDPLNKSDDAPTWDDLREKFKLNQTYPTTIVIERGNMTKAFSGFKPWIVMEPHVKAAKLKKKDDDNEQPKPRRRRFLDFLFPPTGDLRRVSDSRGVLDT